MSIELTISNKCRFKIGKSNRKPLWATMQMGLLSWSRNDLSKVPVLKLNVFKSSIMGLLSPVRKENTIFDFTFIFHLTCNFCSLLFDNFLWIEVQ